MTELNSIPVLTRREIEALMAAPLIESFIEELGREKAWEAAGRVIGKMARESGAALRDLVGGNSLKHVEEVLSIFSRGGALEMDRVEATPTRLAVNITRCRYAEMYKKHGLEKFGGLLSCSRDFGLFAVFNPKIVFRRTQTIMDGADYCDFRFEEVE
ncbi:MAG: L-2-amino-thiazoline-4-carboxylic acid hydrolase [Pseudomonadota bacterium]